MKKILLSATAFLSIVASINAQNIQPCNTYGVRETLIKTLPGYAAKLNAAEAAAAAEYQAFLQNSGAGSKTASLDPNYTFTVPVVFHVLHLGETPGSASNINDQICIDALAQVNKDYSKQGSDTSSIDALFQPLYKNARMHFKLAQKDPNGNCTNGIIHHYNPKTNWDQSDIFNYQYSTYAAGNWSPAKYLNIYIVKNIIGSSIGIIVGYTYLPGTSPVDAADAIVYRNDFLSGLDARSLSHEIGHWFGLSHTFGSTNEPGLECSNDDIADTPKTTGFFSTCPKAANYAGTPSVTNPANSSDIVGVKFGPVMSSTTSLNSLSGSIIKPIISLTGTLTTTATETVALAGSGIAGGYSDFSAIYGNDFNAGTTNVISIESTASPTVANYVAVYCDYNRDGDFLDANEKLFNVGAGSTIQAGSNQTICSSTNTVALTGSFTPATGNFTLTTGIATGLKWTTLGDGFFSNPNGTSTTYSIGINDNNNGQVKIIASTTGIGSLIPATDTVIITIQKLPIVNAGSDKIICLDTMIVNVTGTISGFTSTGIWSTLGNGSFGSITNLSSTYTLSSSDSIAGSVKLVLKSTNNGLCNQSSDTLQITVLPSSIASIGNDTTICPNSSLALNGSIIGVSQGVWSSNGSGVFIPNNTALNASYLPSTNDINNAGIFIKLTPTSGCQITSDSLLLSFYSAPIVNAGNNVAICASINTLALNGSVSIGSTTGIWTTSGTGIFLPNDSTLNATYQLSVGDSASGTFKLFLTSTNSGFCGAVADSIIINNTTTPSFAFTSSSATVCANNISSALSGTITGGSGQGEWTTSGSGTFSPSSTSLNPSYIPSIADINNGNVTITLTPINTCSPNDSSLTLSITPSPTVSAGVDLSICRSLSGIILSGNVNTVPSGVQWTTSGLGSFIPSSSTSLVTYNPLASDTDTLMFVLTTTGNGSCNAVKDTMFVYRNQPIADFSQTNSPIGQSTIFTDNSIVSVGSIASWNWNFGDGNTSINQNPTNVFDTVKVYSVTLAITTSAGCLSTITKTISISPVPVFVFYGNQTFSVSTVIPAGLKGPSRMRVITSDAPITSALFAPASGEVEDYTLNIGLPSCDNVRPNIENIMDYSSCPKMFTQGQVAKMRQSASSIISNRSLLVSDENLYNVGFFNTLTLTTFTVAPVPPSTVITTYTAYVASNPSGATPCGPVADFASNKSTTCAGQSIVFNSTSYNSTPTSYSWVFEGGSPATSTLATQSVNYAIPGTYSVSLTVSNGNGSSTKSVNSFVTAGWNAGLTTLPYSENFESGQWWPAGWATINEDVNTHTWQMSNYGAGTLSNSYHSLVLPNANYVSNFFPGFAGNVDIMETPNFDFTNTTNISLSFDYSFARKTGVTTDEFKLQYSTDCGGTWSNISPTASVTASVMAASGGIVNAPYIPLSSLTTATNPNPKWVTKTIIPSLLTSLNNKRDVKFRFYFMNDTEGGQSQNLYIDNINISGTVGINEFENSLGLSIYPNPTSSSAIIELTSPKDSKIDILVYDVTGRIVEQNSVNALAGVNSKYSVNASSKLNSGIYFVTLIINNNKITKKLIID